jgi:UDP-N-acetylglucosamine diphosphorylase/glucosamine-1-phosphate N-acetyltransferase
MQIVLYEDRGFVNLQPLTFLHPVFDLRCGALLLREKVQNILPGSRVTFRVRPAIEALVKEKYPESVVNGPVDLPTLFINSRVIFSGKALQQIDAAREAVYLTEDGTVAATCVHSKSSFMIDSDGFPLFSESMSHIEIDGCKVIEYPWHLVHSNSSEILADFTNFAPDKGASAGTSVHIINPASVSIAESARIDPGVVIDASDGPVWIDSQAHIMAQATLVGPCYVGKKSRVKIGAKIYEGTSIGPVCKVGGEVEESIIHSYSNKQHDGFLGHSYLGQWVNIGADTNNSDLKNNYGPVRVTINGQEIDSGTTFVGLTMGDHGKSGINTMFNTGTVVGIFSNVYGADFPPKSIPSFTWGGAAGLVEFRLDKALEVARKVMQRRNITMGAAEEKRVIELFNELATERENLGQ